MSHYPSTMSCVAFQLDKLHKLTAFELEFQVGQVLNHPKQAKQDNECSGDHIVDVRDC